MFRSTKVLVAVLLVVGLSMVAPAAARATPVIRISDILPGVPVWDVTAGIDVITGSVVGSPENLTFDAILHIPFGDGVLNLSRNSLFVLYESPGVVSDWLQVLTPRGFGGDGAVDWEQFIRVIFASDIDGVPLGLPPGDVTCGLVEDGTWQNCSLFSQTGANILDLRMQSDVDTVPDPGSTLLLFGISLVGLRAWRTRQ